MKLALIVFLFSGLAANAAPLSFDVSKTAAKTEQKSLKSEARVKNISYTVSVPKDWSFTAVSSGDAGIMMAPSANIAQSPTSFVVRTVRKTPVDSLDKLYSELILLSRKDKTRRVRMLTWHGNRWVMEIYQSKDKKSEIWNAVGVTGNVELSAVATVPYTQRAKLEPVFMDLYGKISIP